MIGSKYQIVQSKVGLKLPNTTTIVHNNYLDGNTNNMLVLFVTFTTQLVFMLPYLLSSNYQYVFISYVRFLKTMLNMKHNAAYSNPSVAAT